MKPMLRCISKRESHPDEMQLVDRRRRFDRGEAEHVLEHGVHARLPHLPAARHGAQQPAHLALQVRMLLGKTYSAPKSTDKNGPVLYCRDYIDSINLVWLESTNMSRTFTTSPPYKCTVFGSEEWSIIVIGPLVYSGVYFPVQKK